MSSRSSSSPSLDYLSVTFSLWFLASLPVLLTPLSTAAPAPALPELVAAAATVVVMVEAAAVALVEREMVGEVAELEELEAEEAVVVYDRSVSDCATTIPAKSIFAHILAEIMSYSRCGGGGRLGHRGSPKLHPENPASEGQHKGRHRRRRLRLRRLFVKRS